MIDLTPLDVRKKKDDFKRSVRGYDPSQVDAFLEVVSDRLEQLVREHGSLTDRVASMQRQLETYQERERALNEALLAAQELREEARSQAERDAQVRLREAETHAEAILLDADQAIRHSQRRLEDLRARRRHFLKSLRSVMERFEDYLELEEARLESEPEDLGDLIERLESDLGEADEEMEARKPAGAGANPSIERTPAGIETRAARGRDGQAEQPDAGMSSGDRRGASEASPDEREEANPGSRIATPSSITPSESGESGQ